MINPKEFTLWRLFIAIDTILALSILVTATLGLSALLFRNFTINLLGGSFALSSLALVLIAIFSSEFKIETVPFKVGEILREKTTIDDYRNFDLYKVVGYVVRYRDLAIRLETEIDGEDRIIEHYAHNVKRLYEKNEILKVKEL